MSLVPKQDSKNIDITLIFARCLRVCTAGDKYDINYLVEVILFRDLLYIYWFIKGIMGLGFI